MEGDVEEFGRGLPVVQSLGQNAQRKGLDVRDGVIPSGAVAEDAWKLRDLGNPPAILFTLKFHPEGDAHRNYCSTGRMALPNHALHPTGDRSRHAAAGEPRC